MIELIILGGVFWLLAGTEKKSQTAQKKFRFKQSELNGKVFKIAKELGINPEWIFSVMAFETAYTLNPQIKNAINCGGLIGFCPVYNKERTKYIDGSYVWQKPNLLDRSASYQLEYVKKFFQDNIKVYGKPKDKLETYLMVFHPSSLRYVHKPNHIVGSEISMDWARLVAKQNAKAFLDTNGYVTIRSLRKAVEKLL